MILKFFDTSDVDALAERMGRELIQRVQPGSVDARGRKVEAKQQKAHDMVLRQAHDFARNNKLNVYTKARLANRFKWVLIDAGYPKEFVDRMTYELATVVTSAQSERA